MSLEDNVIRTEGICPFKGSNIPFFLIRFSNEFLCSLTFGETKINSDCAKELLDCKYCGATQFFVIEKASKKDFMGYYYKCNYIGGDNND